MTAKDLCPLTRRIAFTHKYQTWVVSLTIDEMYCHAIAFASQAAFGRQHDLQAARHFGKALKLLRRRIEDSDNEAMIGDNTLMSIMVLATSALVGGQLSTAREHLLGIKKIMALRGGFGSFTGSVKLFLEILRCDIGVSLSTGSLPVFFKDPTTEMPWPLFNLAGLPSEDLRTITPSIDGRLVHIWESVKDFCRMVNNASLANTQLPEQMFLDNMASSMYPLFGMEFETGSNSDMTRLSLLSFCSSSFLQWHNMGIRYTWLPTVYREALVHVGQRTDDIPPRITLWIFSIGAISGLMTDRSWLTARIYLALRECDISSWASMRKSLRRFPWIDFVHDEPMRKIYQAAMLLAPVSSDED